MDEQIPISDETVAPETQETAVTEQTENNNQEQQQQEEQEEKLYTIKINGVEKQINEEQLMRYVQKDIAGDEKLRKANDLTQQVGRLVENLKTKPLDILSQMGVDIDKMLEERLNSRIEEYAMTPEKKEALKYKKELDALKAEHDRVSKEKEETVRQQQIREYQEAFEAKIIDTIEKYRLPKNQDIGREMAYYMEKAIAKGIDPDMGKIAEYIKGKIRSSVDLIDDETEMQRLLQSDFYKKMKELEMKQVKNPIREASPQKREERKETKKKYSSWEEMEEDIRRGLK